VQGQLEHPAVVPVYDVGREAGDRLFFTMKRVTGDTLASVLDALRSGDAETQRRFGRHRLLAAFQLVCQCIDYAHQRGVVHRDIKPANIMFGDFGEVYVLDWGVARVGTSPAGITLGIPDTPSGVSGTPGYMPPEQLAETAAVDGRTDIYALGAILFEILTWEPLHRGSDVAELVASTRRGADTRASSRCPDRDVPPELEAICERATALAPEDRFASVHELSGEVERFLEGRRDVELRRDIAARHVAEARRQADVALEGGPGADDARSHALGELGRALALRPDAPEATRVLAELLTTPPRVLPPEARAAIDAQLSEEGKAASRLAGYTFAVMAACALLMTQLVELRSTSAPLLFFGSAALAALVAFANRNRPTDRAGMAIISLAGVAIATTSVILGPLVLTPILAVALGIISVNIGRLSRFRVLSLTIAALVVVVPATLEMTGVIPSSYVNEDGSWHILSKIAIVPAHRTYPTGLLFTSVVALVGSGIFVARMSDRMSELRRELQLHAWHLSQLVPEEARSSAAASTKSIARPRG
jgi:serine/threonine-protein kinase